MNRDLLGRTVSMVRGIMPQDNGSDVREVDESGIYRPRTFLELNRRENLRQQIARLEKWATEKPPDDTYGRKTLLGYADLYRKELNAGGK